MDFSSEPLGGGAGAAALTGATGVGTVYPRPCFLAARPQAVTGGHLCLQTPPDSSPIDCEVYNDAPVDAAGEAIQSVNWVEGEAAGKASDKTAEAAESGLGSAGENVVDIAEGGPSKVADTAQDVGGKVKEATEGAWDATEDATQDVADKVDAAVKEFS